MRLIFGWTYDLMWDLRFVAGAFADAANDLMNELLDRWSDDE